MDSIVVDASSVGGNIVGDMTVCHGMNSVLLTLSGHTGSIQKWQSSTNSDFSNPVDLVNTNATYTATDLTQTTYYRAVVNAGTCDVLSDVAVVTVDRATASDISSSVPNQVNGMHSNTEHPITTSYFGVTSLYTADVDSDGDMDLLGTAEFEDAITWWENDGMGLFTEHAVSTSFIGASSVSAQDVDGDGDMDVLGTARGIDDISWWENDGSESFTKHTIKADFDSASHVSAADLDGDGDMDVLGAANVANDLTWWENNGSNVFTEHIIDGNFGGARQVYAADIDGDGDMDVIGAARIADDIAWWENDGNEFFTKHVIVGHFNGVESIFAADMDNDGDLDILGAANLADDITWWENDSANNFIPHVIDENFDGASSVLASDVDGDGDMDVLATASVADEVVWWENDGSTAFTKHIITGSFLGAIHVAVADIDGDADKDVIGAANISDDITWWENVLPPATLISSDDDDIICPGEIVTFSSSDAVNYEFFLNGNSIQNGPDSTYIYSSPKNGDTVHVVVTALNGCQANSVDFIIRAVDTMDISATICSDTFFVFNNQNLNMSGVYLDTLVQAQGCDSIIRLTLTVDSSDADGDGVCDSYDQCPDTHPAFMVDEFGCPLPCQMTLNLSDTISSGIYQAAQYIHSDGIILNAETVGFKAELGISLNMGFEVELGAEFIATIEDCP